MILASEVLAGADAGSADAKFARYRLRVPKLETGIHYTGAPHSHLPPRVPLRGDASMPAVCTPCVARGGRGRKTIEQSYALARLGGAPLPCPYTLTGTGDLVAALFLVRPTPHLISQTQNPPTAIRRPTLCATL